MYFAALTDGLADIPDPGPDARAEARRLLAEQGPAALHASLAHVDPATAARLKPEDSQRIARAWEVWRGTGMGSRRVAEPAERAGPVAVQRDPPRSAARRPARRYRDAVRGDAAGRRSGGGARSAGAEPRSSPAGDARAWCAGTVRLSGRLVVPAGSRTPHRTGHRSIHKTASDMVSPSRPCTPDPRFYD